MAQNARGMGSNPSLGAILLIFIALSAMAVVTEQGYKGGVYYDRVPQGMYYKAYLDLILNLVSSEF